MSVLVLIAVLCCIGLLSLGGLLVYAVHQRPARRMQEARLVAASSFSVRSRRPVRLFRHPRMDLAAGLAPENQAVDLDQRRSRRESSETPVASAVGVGVVFEPFGERQKHSKTYRQRLDLVYANEAMGDLSDPVAAAGWHLRHDAVAAK